MAYQTEKDTFQNIKSIVKPFLNLMVKIEDHGLEHVPGNGPGILVGNHRSDMDPFVVASVVPRYMSWIAADYTTRIPIMKNLIRETGVIPMDISGNVSVSSIKKIMHVLKQGELLGIFPEGHDYMVRNDFSSPMTGFHPGFATFAYRSRVPIIPFALIPYEEKVETIPVPSAMRSLIGLPEEVCTIPHRVTYKRVLIEFAPPIGSLEFRNKPEKEAVPYLAERTRTTIEGIQKKHGMLNQ